MATVEWTQPPEPKQALPIYDAVIIGEKGRRWHLIRFYLVLFPPHLHLLILQNVEGEFPRKLRLDGLYIFASSQQVHVHTTNPKLWIYEGKKLFWGKRHIADIQGIPDVSGLASRPTVLDKVRSLSGKDQFSNFSYP